MTAIEYVLLASRAGASTQAGRSSEPAGSAGTAGVPGADVTGATGGVGMTGAAGVSVTADFTYYFRCRFLDDAAEFDNFMHDLWQLKQLQFVSVLP